MEAAARGIKRVHLELGGKAPVVVFDDVDLERLVNGAPHRRVLERRPGLHGRVAAVRRAARAWTRSPRPSPRSRGSIEPQDPFENPDAALGPLVSTAHRERVHGYVARAGRQRRRGAHGRADRRRRRRLLPPDGRRGRRQDDEIVQEEVFGPVISIVAYEDEREAIELANDVEYGLAASVWSSNIDRALRVASAIRAGTVWINDHGPTAVEMPFGGFKQSGIGRDLSVYAIEEHTELKHIAITVGDPGAGQALRSTDPRSRRRHPGRDRAEIAELLGCMGSRPVSRAASIEVTVLVGGANNRNYVVESREAKYALRIANQLNERMAVDRPSAVQAQKDAAAGDLAPAVLASRLPEGHVLSEFVEGEILGAG